MRDRLDEFGDAEVVVILFTRQRNLRGYRARYGIPFTCVTSEDLAAYRAYGLRRGPWWRVWGPPVWLAYARLVARGRRFERPTEDTLQLGGDFVVDADGELVYAFRSTRPDDRPAIAELLTALSS